MSMLPVSHMFLDKVTPSRRVKVGEEDGTPIYAVQPVTWPKGLNGSGYADIQPPTSKATLQGTVTTQSATVFMEPEVYDVLQENDQLAFDGRDWRIDGISRLTGLWGPHHSEIKVTRQVSG